jgi:3-oxoacyl-[acyl-carrier protein] reductase
MSERSGDRIPDLQGHVSVITGAGSGVGRATAEALARRGARLGLISRTEAAIEETAERVRAAGGEAIILPADVGDRGAIQRAMRDAVEAFGEIDSLVLAAGIGVYGPTESYAIEDWERTLRTNLTGAFICSQAAVPALRRSRRGAIIAIASGAGKQGYAELAAYSASKFGLMGLMQSLAAEFSDDGIRVSTIVPGSILTEFGERPIDEKERLRGEGRKYLMAGDVARAVVYLLETPDGAWTQELNLWPF